MNPTLVISDIYSILWSDLVTLKRRWSRYLITTLMSPLLYLMAFGWGLGRGISINGMSYLEFVIPGIIALTAMNTSFNGAGIRLNVDRLYFRSFDESLMAPVSDISLLIGRSMIGMIRGLISSSVFVMLALTIAPSMRIEPLFFVVLLMTCMTFASMGVLAALLAKSHEDMATFSSLILIPMTFLGGTFFSLSQVPDWLRLALYILPLTHSSACLRAAALSQPMPWGSFIAIILFMSAFLILGGVALRRLSE
ncbi:MAG TPA: ABC transporter permease [Methanothrix sp.]|nr:ABC transporter permease [Methanothrix sp.]HPO89185.1 ABC transporter permease [Methanothrix sp.]